MVLCLNKGTCQTDCEALQRNLDSLEWYSNAWGMKFNIKKCQISSITSGKSHSTYLSMWSRIVQCPGSKFCIFGLLLQMSCLGPLMHSIRSRANSNLGFLRRNLRHCPAKLKETAYIILVHCTLEYAASIWDPHSAKDCDILENSLLRRSSKVMCVRCCMISAGMTLKTFGRILYWLYFMRLSLGMWALILVRSAS